MIQPYDISCKHHRFVLFKRSLQYNGQFDIALFILHRIAFIQVCLFNHFFLHKWFRVWIFTLILSREGISWNFKRILLAHMEISICFQVIQDNQITFLNLVTIYPKFLTGWHRKYRFLVYLISQLNLTRALIFNKSSIINPQLLAGHLVLQNDTIALDHHLAILGIDHDLVVFLFFDWSFVQ